MQDFKQRIHILLRDDCGATAVEYVLIASVLCIALIPALANTSSGAGSLYSRAGEYFNAIWP